MSQEINQVNEFPLNQIEIENKPLKHPGVKKLEKVLKFIQQAFDLKFKSGFHSVKIKISNADLKILPYGVIYIEVEGQKIKLQWSNDKEMIAIDFKIGSYEFSISNVHIIFEGHMELRTYDNNIIIELEPYSKVFVYSS
uniref:Uncharacterized protein n=1 Tax=Sulfolobus islandicus rod-shaped virus 1 TaxID=157898 RepID=Q5W366_SIRV1|nr:hypothetical protein [Sulfolobus islandicus rod-shaped virus 1]